MKHLTPLFFLTPVTAFAHGAHPHVHESAHNAAHTGLNVGLAVLAVAVVWYIAKRFRS